MNSNNYGLDEADRRDSTLVALAKAGNALAIDQLIRNYWPAAYRAAAKILRSHADAEEAAQDALCSAVAHLSAFREESSFKTWIHRIAVNHSLMSLRRKHARPDACSPVPIELVSSFIGGSPNPEQLLRDAEGRSFIEEALDRLPGLYLAVLQLAAFDGESTNEIAKRIGISPGAVKTRLNRGRARLRRDLSRRSRSCGTEKGGSGKARTASRN